MVPTSSSVHSYFFPVKVNIIISNIMIAIIFIIKNLIISKVHHHKPHNFQGSWHQRDLSSTHNGSRRGQNLHEVVQLLGPGHHHWLQPKLANHFEFIIVIIIIISIIITIIEVFIKNLFQLIIHGAIPFAVLAVANFRLMMMMVMMVTMLLMVMMMVSWGVILSEGKKRFEKKKGWLCHILHSWENFGIYRKFFYWNSEKRFSQMASSPGLSGSCGESSICLELKKGFDLKAIYQDLFRCWIIFIIAENISCVEDL